MKPTSEFFPSQYDEAQTGYYNLISLWSANGFSVPKTVTDLKRTSIIIEALSAESMYTLTPAYYEITLKTSLAVMRNHQRCLISFSASRIYELGIMFGWAVCSICRLHSSVRIPQQLHLRSKRE